MPFKIGEWKPYYEKNGYKIRQRAIEKVFCESCNKYYSRYNLQSHYKRKIHINKLKNNIVKI